MPPTSVVSSSSRQDERHRSRAQSLSRELESAGTWFRDESVKSLRAFAEKSDEERTLESDSRRSTLAAGEKDEYNLTEPPAPQPERTSRYDFPYHTMPNYVPERRGASLDLPRTRRSGRTAGGSERTHSIQRDTRHGDIGHGDVGRVAVHHPDSASPPPPFSRHKSRTNLRDTSTPARSRRTSLIEASAPTLVQQEPEDNLESRLSTAHEEKLVHRADPPGLSTLYTVSYLILFSILGTVARLGIQWFTFYPGTPSTFPVLWANFAGSLILGFLSEDQTLFRNPSQLSILNPNAQDAAVARTEHSRYRKTIPLFIGLSTGFCGSLTSFSSFIRDMFLAASNDLTTPLTNTDATTTLTLLTRNNGYSVEATLAVAIITVAVSLAALSIGAQLASFLTHFGAVPSLTRFTRLFNPTIAFIGPAVWAAMIILSATVPARYHLWRGQSLFALVFAPVGCLLRWYVSLRLNSLLPAFPMGTFAVNIFGTAVLGMSYDLQHVKLPGVGPDGVAVDMAAIAGCQVLQGVMDGFCGCLTTVSTWVLELRTLRRRHAWVYGATSVAVGFGVLVVIMGSVKWGVGWIHPVCVTAW